MGLKSIPVKGGWVYQPTAPVRSPLVVEEGTVCGVKYQTVRFYFSWDLNGDWGGINAWDQMSQWCEQSFGPTPEDGVWTAGARWYANNSKFWFRDPEDLSLFLLKWQ